MIDTAAESTAGDALVAMTIRSWSIERRSRAHAQLTALVRASSRRAWRDRHPTLSAKMADIAWAEHLYGAKIGSALRVRCLDRA